MRYILASNNNGKLREMKVILAETGAEVVSQREAGADFEAEETGTTFEENALIKARAACQALGEPAIADKVPPARHAHARIDGWTAALEWILARLAENIPAPDPELV